MNSRKIKFKYKDCTTLTLYVQVKKKVKNLAVFEERCNLKTKKCFENLHLYMYLLLISYM